MKGNNQTRMNECINQLWIWVPASESAGAPDMSSTSRLTQWRPTPVTNMNKPSINLCQIRQFRRETWDGMTSFLGKDNNNRCTDREPNFLQTSERHNKRTNKSKLTVFLFCVEQLCDLPVVRRVQSAGGRAAGAGPLQECCAGSGAATCRGTKPTWTPDNMEIVHLHSLVVPNYFRPDIMTNCPKSIS